MNTRDSMTERLKTWIVIPMMDVSPDGAIGIICFHFEVEIVLDYQVRHHLF